MVKILLVEDNKQFLDSMFTALKRRYELDTAMSYNSAINLLNKNHYDVVITDGEIPERDGGSVGSHGNLSEEDYRGSQVAEYAKGKGIIVIGQTSNPKKLKNCDVVIEKKRLNYSELIPLIDNLVAKKKSERVSRK